jgi:hypothetical protein
MPRSALWIVADQLADECRASPDGGHTSAAFVVFVVFVAFRCRIEPYLDQVAPLRGAGAWRQRRRPALGGPRGARRATSRDSTGSAQLTRRAHIGCMRWPLGPGQPGSRPLRGCYDVMRELVARDA